MDKDIRKEFLNAILNLKKIGMNMPAKNDMHMGEVVLMRKIEEGLSRDCNTIYVSDIQDKLNISKPAVSQTLNSLEKKGMIERKIDVTDRRKIAVSITAKGRETIREMKDFFEVAIDRVILRLGEEDTRNVISLFNKLAAALDEIKNNEETSK